MYKYWRMKSMKEANKAWKYGDQINSLVEVYKRGVGKLNDFETVLRENIQDYGYSGYFKPYETDDIYYECFYAVLVDGLSSRDIGDKLGVFPEFVCEFYRIGLKVLFYKVVREAVAEKFSLEDGRLSETGKIVFACLSEYNGEECCSRKIHCCINENEELVKEYYHLFSGEEVKVLELYRKGIKEGGIADALEMDRVDVKRILNKANSKIFDCVLRAVYSIFN